METTEIINGYKIESKWKNGQRGMTAIATRAGKKYFLKKYTKCVLPTDGAMFNAETAAFKRKQFESFVDIRKKVISKISPVAGAGGNIIIPCDYFVNNIHYYEATEFIEGVIPDDELDDFLASLTYDKIMLLMKTAAGALSAVHSSGIIHSDLKSKNIIIVKNGSSNFVAKLIDFDSSYPENEKKFVGGDDVFCSPELFMYSNTEDEEEGEELLKRVSNKTDIFALGVIFHYYLSRSHPEAVELSEGLTRRKAAFDRAGKTAIFHANELLLEGCELKLSDKITSVNLKALLYDMLDMDPEKRPTAMQVLMRLKEGEPKIETPWPEHSLTLDNAKLGADKVVGLKRVSGSLSYEVIYQNGKKKALTKEELVSLGYAKEAYVPKGFGDVWEEYGHAFDEEKMAARGYVGATKETLGGKKGYRLNRSDGSGMFFSVDKLRGLGYFKKSTEAASAPKAEEPKGSLDRDTVEKWPEHSIEFDFDAIKAKGFLGISKGTMNGTNGYYLDRPGGVRQFIRVEMLVALKMARRI